MVTSAVTAIPLVGRRSTGRHLRRPLVHKPGIAGPGRGGWARLSEEPRGPW